MTEDPSANINGTGSWVLQTNQDYTTTVDGSGLNTIEFDREASGTIELSDGSELIFQNVEKIEWYS